MAERTEYSVFRFLEQNGYCHMISDYVKGISVMQYVKEEYPVSKECLWRWMAEIARQLEQYYKWEDQKAYGFVNPYALIIDEESRIMLLDVTDPENEDLIRNMQKKKIRMLFVKKEHILTQNAVLEDDIFGLGKTFQFMMEKCHLTEKYTVREKHLTGKIIEKCLKGKKCGIRMMAEIQSDLRKFGGIWCKGDDDKEPAKRNLRKWIIGGGSAFIGIAIITLALGMRPVESKQERAPTESDTNSVVPKTMYTEMDKIYLELGVMYLVEMDDYDKGQACLEKVSDNLPLGNIYLTIFGYIKKGGSERFIQSELEEGLIRGKEILQEEEIREWIKGKEYWYKIPFMMTYGMLGTGKAWDEAEKLGEEMKREILWNEENRNQEKTLRKYLGKAYEVKADYEKAAAEYERLKELEETKEGLEEIYLCLEKIYDAKGDLEQSWGICRESIERIPDSEKIWVAYLEKHLKDVGIERQVCAELVKKALKMNPQLIGNTEFVKLQKQYEITMKGEEVWVGK